MDDLGNSSALKSTQLNIGTTSPHGLDSSWDNIKRQIKVTGERPSTVGRNLDIANDNTLTRLYMLHTYYAKMLTELWFYVPLDTKQVISETFFPANLLA